MQVVYDSKADILTITLRETLIVESDKTKPGVVLDYDAFGNIVSMEVLEDSLRVLQPTRIEYELTGQPA
jgi:uncharacterized protein YuzE